MPIDYIAMTNKSSGITKSQEDEKKQYQENVINELKEIGLLPDSYNIKVHQQLVAAIASAKHSQDPDAACSSIVDELEATRESIEIFIDGCNPAK